MGERQHPVLSRTGPLATELDDLPVADRHVEVAAADPVARLEHDDGVPHPVQLGRGGEAGKSGTHDDNIDILGTSAWLGARRVGPDHRCPARRDGPAHQSAPRDSRRVGHCRTSLAPPSAV